MRESVIANPRVAAVGGPEKVRGLDVLARTTIVAALLVVACCSFSAEAHAASSAVRAYAYSRSFASEYQLQPYAEGNTDLAVQPKTGNLLVPAGYTGGIDIFSPSAGPGSAPLATFGEGTFWRDLAVASGSGDVYAVNEAGTEIQRFTPGASPTIYAADPSFQAPTGTQSEYFGGIAVDPTTGNLIVLKSGADQVLRLGSSGEVLSEFAGNQTGAGLLGVAIAPSGTLFIGESVSPPRVNRLSPSGVVLGRFFVGFRPGAGPGTGLGAIRNIAFDPTTGALDIAATATEGVKVPLQIETFTEAGERLSVVPTPESFNEKTALGIAPDPVNGALYLSTVDTASLGELHEFAPVSYPGVSGPTVSSIQTTSAHLASTVDFGEGPPPGSFAKLEYSVDSGRSWQEVPGQNEGPGVVEADLTGLEAKTEYFARVVAGNEKATHVGDPVPFTTATGPPEVVTGRATEIGEAGATLTGSINPLGEPTEYFFEYGPTETYGSRAPAGNDLVVGAGRTAKPVDQMVADLRPSTAYHYRLVAVSPEGTVPGADRSFTTAAAGSSFARVYEQVTPIEKGGSTIDRQIGFFGATNSQISYVTLSPTGAESSPLFARAFSRRGPDGWEYGGNTDPPLTVAGNALFSTTLALSPDFSKAFVVSNRALTPGAIEGGANLYVSDLRSRSYTLVAATGGLNGFTSFGGLSQWNKFIYADADFSTIIFASKVPLLPGVSGSAIYRWTATGGLTLESTDAEGTLPSATEAVEPQLDGIVRRASDDGTRNYYALTGKKEGSEGEPVGVYLREDGKVRAISVSRRQGDPRTPVGGEFLGTGRDGRFAFFASNAPLTEDGAPGLGGIYRYDASNDSLEYVGASIYGNNSTNATGEVRFVLGVSEDGQTIYFKDAAEKVEVFDDGQLSEVPDGESPVELGLAEVTPDGRYLVFQRGFEGPIYLYDHATGVSTCVSCLPDGADPGGASLLDPDHVTGNEPPRNIDNQGDVFFETTAALLPSDTNAVKDVYEYGHEGTLRLISPGNAPFPARLADISADGGDVYFTTAQGLAAQDTDKEIDIYDARIGGGLASQNQTPVRPCEGEACSGPSVGSPPAASNGSETTPGAPPHRQVKKKGKRQCRKAHKGARPRCVKKHSRHHRHADRKGRASS